MNVLLKVTGIVVPVLVVILGGGVAWIRSDVRDAQAQVAALTSQYHEIDKDVAVIRRDLRAVTQSLGELRAGQAINVRLLEDIHRRIGHVEP